MIPQKIPANGKSTTTFLMSRGFGDPVPFLSTPCSLPLSSPLFPIRFLLPQFAPGRLTSFAMVKMSRQKATFIQMRKQGLFSSQSQVIDPHLCGECQGQDSKQLVTSHPQSRATWNKCVHASGAQLVFSKPNSPRLSSWKGLDHPTSINPVRKTLPEANLK